MDATKGAPGETLRDLELLIDSRYPIIAIDSQEEDRVEAVLTRLAIRLMVPFYTWTVTEGLRRAGASNSIYETQKPVSALSNLGAMNADGIALFKGLQKNLEDPDVIRKLQDMAIAFSKSRRAVVLTGSHIELPSELETLAARFTLELPAEAELAELAKRVVTDLARDRRIKVDISKGDFIRLVEAMRGLTLFEAERALTRAILDDLSLTKADIVSIVEIKKNALEKGGLLEYSPPSSGLAQVGGLANLKAWLAKRKAAFTPEAKKFGITPPKGIVLLGVQGCGKTLAAKAVAAEWQVPLLKLEAGRLYDKYVGESEKNLERALAVAEGMAPCVLLIDEIEKAFASAGASDADGGLSKRIFGRLLGWLQEHESPIFVVATCNQIEQIPPELMRKGRFDEIFFIDLPRPSERREIFATHLTRRKRDPEGFDLDQLAAASEGFSGSEIEQAVVSALYTAFSAGQELSTEFLLSELRATKPLSVTRWEEIDALRLWARGRAVMAS